MKFKLCKLLLDETSLIVYNESYKEITDSFPPTSGKYSNEVFLNIEAGTSTAEASATATKVAYEVCKT